MQALVNKQVCLMCEHDLLSDHSFIVISDKDPKLGKKIHDGNIKCFICHKVCWNANV